MKFKFDKDARLRFWCKAENNDEAADQLMAILHQLEADHGVRIDIDNHFPEESGIPEEDDDGSI